MFMFQVPFWSVSDQNIWSNLSVEWKSNDKKEQISLAKKELKYTTG